MAVKAEFGDAGFAIWNEWSATAGNYNAQAARDVWRSIKQGPVGIGTLFFLAKQHGYQAGKTSKPRPTPKPTHPPASPDTSAYAKEVWLRADCSDDAVTSHPYAVAKGVVESAGGAGRAVITGRVVGKSADCIIVPIRAIRTNKVVGIQAINARGKKQTFGQMAGHGLLLGNVLNKSINWFICEGWSSAFSLTFHHLHGHAVCAASFGKQNMDRLAREIADVYQPERIVIVREDDT